MEDATRDELVQLSDYLDAVRDRLRTAQTPEDREYLSSILEFYKTHQVVGSYVDHGVHFDRVVMPAAPAVAPPFVGSSGQATRSAARQSQGAEATTAAVQRPSLDREKMYFRKGPTGAALPPRG